MSAAHAALGSILHLLAKTTTDPLVETLLKNHLGAVGAEAVQFGTQVLGEAVAPAAPVAAEPADHSGFVTRLEALAMIDAAIAKLSPKQVEINPLASLDAQSIVDAVAKELKSNGPIAQAIQAVVEPKA